MDMGSAKELLQKLRDRKVIYESKGGVQITATHTARLSPYDFAVGLVSPGRAEFYPTHVRLLIDLHLKRVGNTKDSEFLFCALEAVYRGEDPTEYAPDAAALSFPMQLDEADVNLFYTQLLMIEQDFSYAERSKLSPPREYLMRFIRWVYSGDNQIDKVITNAVRNWPPPVRYQAAIQC